MTPDSRFARVLDAIRVGHPAAGDMLRDYLLDFAPIADADAPFGADAADYLDDGLLDAKGSA